MLAFLHCLIDDSLDNSEHIYTVRRIIETISENIISERIPSIDEWIETFYSKCKSRMSDPIVEDGS
ncbi:MAG: hypothetical protein AB7O96_17385 [Pseudobdellovibrionaceae bacterium]